MRAFRFKKSIPVSYVMQGYIYFASRLYKLLPAKERQKIRGLCREAGGEYAGALQEFVTTDAGAVAVCQKHYISQSTLERAVKRYYIAYSEHL